MDLDTHMNVLALGRNCNIINYSGNTAEVQPFSPEHKELDKVPRVDCVV